jgi:hypothetical protein
MMNESHMTVIIDNCAVDRFAERGINPVEELRGTEFSLAYTPDLKTEYEMALTNTAATSEQAKALIRSILLAGKLFGFFGFDGAPCLGFDQGVWASQDQCDVISSVGITANARGLPRKRTDAHLVALSASAIVITANSKEAHWRQTLKGTGTVIQWGDLEQFLNKGDFPTALRLFLALP